jgi:rhodanese-related sulfurtransferase
LFDVQWYLEQAATAKVGGNPLLHYLERGVRKKKSPNRLFDVPFYLAQNPDVAAAGGEPLAHYLAVGAARGANPHPLFDTVFYLEQNPEVAAAGRNPLEHYLTSGGAEGRDPHPLFQSAFYLDQNPDTPVVNVHVPYEGHIEGTDAFVDFETIATWKDLPDDVDAPIVLYCRSGNMSGQAAADLTALGYTRIIDLEGGMNAWTAAGFELLDDPPAAID